MTEADVATPTRAAFEPCADDGRCDEMAFASPGHLAPTLPVLRQLWRAIAYETGYTPAEIRDLLSRVKFHHGFVGRHESKYDLVPCEESGEGHDYDDDGEPLWCSDVQPTTWAHMRLDPV